MSRRTNSAERKRLLTEAAVALVLEQGAAELSLPELATRAGVSVSLVYRHFPSRVHLLGQLLDTVWGSNGVTDSSSAADLLSAYLTAATTYGELLPELLLHPSGLPELEQQRRALRVRDVDRLADLLTRQGLPAPSAQVVATMLDAALLAGSVHASRTGSVDSVRRVLTVAMSVAADPLPEPRLRGGPPHQHT